MKETIQNIIFPDKEELKRHFNLYYRGTRGIIKKTDEENHLMIPQYSIVEFNTYFNGLSLKKWETYTDLSSLSLNLDIEGKFVIRLCGYKFDSTTPEMILLGEYPFELEQRQTIELPIPKNENQMVAFELEAETACTIYGGKYIGEFISDNIINLSISTTTCKKEKFIKANVQSLKKTLLDKKSDMSNHLYIHIIDNGRTLSEDDFPKDDRIHFYPNKNVGGAGGFARGMIESLRQKVNITHILLMDDDVLIQPESIFKTYILLKHLRDKYKKCFISGAMLYLENIPIQKEDIGTVQPDASFIPLKPELNHNFLSDNLLNEREYPLEKHSYAAWWYCCIPTDTIKKNGLPLPIFVRGDDVEYSLRCNPGFITMNGICVWHMGFVGKFNVGMDHYQVNRNLMIAQSTSEILSGVNVIKKSRLDFRKHLLCFDYNSAEIALRAIEDYLKGPEFIKKDIGEKILLANNALGHQVQLLSKLGNPEIGLGNLYVDLPRKFIEKWLYRITYNGHIFWPGIYKKKIMSIPYGNMYMPSKIAFRNKLIIVNPNNRTGYWLTRDNKRGKELIRRYRRAIQNYRHNKTKIGNSYKENRGDMISHIFWEHYLKEKSR